MKTQNYSRFFNDYFQIDSGRQLLIDQYYSAASDDFDHTCFLDRPLEFREIISSDAIIRILFSLINERVFELVKQLATYEPLDQLTKRRITNLCDQRISEFDPHIEGHAHYFRNELDDICVKWQTKKDVAHSLLALLCKNELCKRVNEHDFFVHLDADVKQYFSEDEQDFINRYYSTVHPYFNCDYLRRKEFKNNPIDVNAVLKIIFNQITLHTFARVRELVIANQYSIDKVNKQMVRLCNQRIATPPEINFPNAKFCNELDELDLDRSDIETVAEQLIELLLCDLDNG